jgi:hypothetical protein
MRRRAGDTTPLASSGETGILEYLLTRPVAATKVAWLSRAVPVRLLCSESLPILPGSGEPGYEDARPVAATK